MLMVAAAVVIVVGLSSVIAVTGGFKNRVETTSLAQGQTQAAPAAVAQAPAQQAPVAAVVKPNRPFERKEEKRSKQEEKSITETVAEAPAAPTAKEPEPASQAIKVVMQIENGRVLKASIANPKPGMDSYEALALRIARQRRFPATSNGNETITINVNR
jgi:ATPase subunit of ABC transporter with duplicated ATPase domains